MDDLWQRVAAVAEDGVVVNALRDCIESEAFDTESVQRDTDLLGHFGKDKGSNLLAVIKHNSQCTRALVDFLRHHHISGNSFSTGIIFWYWPFYKDADEEAVKQDTAFVHIDFGGHSIRETYVEQFFESLKAEVLGSGLVETGAFNEKMDKGDEFLKSSKCRRIVSKSDYDEGVYLLSHVLTLLISSVNTQQRPLMLYITASQKRHLCQLTTYMLSFSIAISPHSAPSSLARSGQTAARLFARFGRGTASFIGRRGTCARSCIIMAARAMTSGIKQ